MPIRLLREGILTSDRVETLDPPAEVFYRRLMSKVDDFGLYDARPSILRASLYPLRIDRVREADITRWIAACEKAGLIALYQHDGKTFMQMLDTGWQTRSEPKYPMPPWGKGEPSTGVANNCLQPIAIVPVVVVGDVVEDEGGTARGRAKSPPRAKGRKRPIPEDFAVSDAVTAWAAEKGYDRIGEHLEAFVRKSKAKGYEYIDWDLAFMEAIREDWAKLRGRGPNGAAPAGESATTSTSEVKRSKQWIAEHSTDVERTPEQHAAIAAKLARARSTIVGQAA
jgi:hypothetical protein